MRQLFLIVILTMNFCAFSQDDKTVTLTVTGQGQTKDEAKQNALRDAIEQAFGTFTSSNTEILNDELLKEFKSLDKSPMDRAYYPAGAPDNKNLCNIKKFRSSTHCKCN